ncbi:MAG TPA: PTS fructose transporter subunit IIA [Accumulibacter sp.]|nr:PTS fructose transporter subunit IIA [Accumulibacter sp.]
MIGIFLITHGSFGESLIQNVCHVLNKRPARIVQLGISAQDDPLEILPLARLLLQEVDEGEGVLLMTDVFGATPGNLALRLLDPGRIEGVAGVNLPMLLRALTYRELGMEMILQKAISGAHDGVIKLTASD